MGKANLNKRERLSRNRMISAGLAKYFKKTVILNNGTAIKAADAIKLFDAASTAEQNATTARAQFIKSVNLAKEADAQVRALVLPIKNLVAGVFGKDSPVMAELGFVSQGQRPSAETRLEAVEKSRATRVARGTMGSRQRAAVHGTSSAEAPDAPAPTGNGSH